MGTFLVQSNCGSDLAVSSIEKLDGKEFFMAPLTEEVIKKADTLLKAWEDASIFTNASDSGQWLVGENRF